MCIRDSARTIARALRLNEDLTEAISLGHDLGHTPFGHAGERALNGMIPGGFRHYEQSVRVVEKLEKDGKGLNLSLIHIYRSDYVLVNQETSGALYYQTRRLLQRLREEHNV